MYELAYLRTCFLSKSVRWLTPALLLTLLVWTMISPTMISAYAGLGGYISEKMLSGASNDSLYLSSTTSGPTVLASVPAITTRPATGAVFTETGSTATLHGNISSLNGMPTANYWFVWGYAPGAMVNTTATTATGTTGDKTTVLAGYNPVLTVYYQFRASTDGSTSGSTMSFMAGGGRGTGYNMMWNILTLVIALVIGITVLWLTGNPIAALIATIIGILAIAIVCAALGVSL